MYFTVYKIINNINGKVYIGCHKTKNLYDGYMGSGKLILAAIKKYGVDNFTKEFIKIFLIASIFSVLGGILGYLIGYLFSDFAMYVIEFYNYEDKVKNLKLSMSEGSGFIAWLSILFLAGFTPLPYKAFTIASGLIAFNLPVFIIVSLISRSLRFFIVAFLSYKFGELFTEYMNKHGSKWFTAIGIFIVIIFVFVYLVLKFNG